MPALTKQLLSWRHGFWLTVSQRLRWSRGTYRERPAGTLKKFDAAQAFRARQLAQQYGVRFESSLNERTAAKNYEYLDILDRGFAALGARAPRPTVLCDVGCASFFYAAALAAFFKPVRLVGVEVEGYRLFRNGYTRIDYARGYLAGLQGAEFVVADIKHHVQGADLITAWFPFLTATAILAWRLPLSLLDPAGFFERVHGNLKPGGLFFMVNHGVSEAELARARCTAAGLCLVGEFREPGVFSGYRSSPAIASWWRPSEA